MTGWIVGVLMKAFAGALLCQILCRLLMCPHDLTINTGLGTGLYTLSPKGDRQNGFQLILSTHKGLILLVIIAPLAEVNTQVSIPL